jgi:hypothetical protein
MISRMCSTLISPRATTNRMPAIRGWASAVQRQGCRSLPVAESTVLGTLAAAPKPSHRIF